MGGVAALGILRHPLHYEGNSQNPTKVPGSGHVTRADKSPLWDKADLAQVLPNVGADEGDYREMNCGQN